MKLPIAAAAAPAEPAMAPNNIAETILTCAKPPGNAPTIALAKLISLLAIPPLFIICPARIKNGMAKMEKLSKPVTTRCAVVVNAGITGIPLTKIVITAAMPILQATGMRNTIKTIKLSTNIVTSIY